MSIILGALAGAGKAAGEIADMNMKSDLALSNETQIAGVRSNLALQNEQAMATFKNTMAHAPLERLGAKAKELSGVEVPQEAAPVTTASGQGMQPYEGPAKQQPTSGLTGNYADLVAKAKTLPIEDQQPYLDQIKSQFGYDKDQAASIVMGKTRKRTNSESLAAAADDAKVNDPVGYAQYEKEIGKPERDERRLDQNDKRLDQNAEAAAAKLDSQFNIQTLRSEVQNARTQAQYDVGMAKVEAAIAKAGAGGGNTDFDKKIKLLKDSGKSDEEIANFITDRKQPSIEDLANGFLKTDPNVGTAKAITPEGALEKARQLRSLVSSLDMDKAVPLPMPTDKKMLKSGATYNTSRGPAVWNGTAFEAK